MKLVIISLLALAPSLAIADKAFNTGKGATWDCAKDPDVAINHGKGTYTFKGACKTINLNGGESTIAIESVESLNVNGGKNKITVDAVDSLNVNGADNTITWKKGKSTDTPAVNTVGNGNKIGKAK